MTVKQRIENLTRLITEKFPGASVGVDAPSRSKGDWFVDIRYGDQSFAIEYRPSLGFGLSSTPSDGYGEGPDEFFADEGSVVDRVTQLASLHGKTEPQRVNLLQDLRSKRQMTQNEIADRLGIRQPTVSKIERREDVNLSTLRRYVEALGGELHVTAKFADGTVELGLGEEAPASGGRHS
jgi:DNA-binding XRE family transcriptional regulator